MDGIYAVVKKYGEDYREWVFKPDQYDDIADIVMMLTDADVEISNDAASWCELATVGEIYEFREGEIEIMEID